MINKSIEEWRGVIGYEGRYMVSNIGNVKSLRRIGASRILKEMILKPSLTTFGYHSVRLLDKNIRIHRIVAIAFIPNTLNKPFVNHKNGIKTDNRVENLEWVTGQENTIHGFRMGLIRHTVLRGEKARFSKLNNAMVYEIRRLYAGGIKSGELGRKFGVHAVTIQHVISGKTWKHLK